MNHDPRPPALKPQPPQPSQPGSALADFVDAADFERWMHAHVARHGFALDASQCEALAELRALYAVLAAEEKPWYRRRPWPFSAPAPRGLYLWGGVGRGKTLLMDSFFERVPLRRKRRAHFHRLMQELHGQLAARQGEADPVHAIARETAREYRLICCDEFHVEDIGDAMIMRRWLQGLFAHGAVLVLTSNQPPAELYRYGLQRAQFLPAINLLEKKLDVVHVDGGTDYRLRAYQNAGVYHRSDSPGCADAALQRAFLAIARHLTDGTATLDIAGRGLRVRQHGAGVAWFDFGALCEDTRGKLDYIEIARHYHTVLVSDIPRFTADNADAMQRFVWMVDEFYDRRVKLICSAAAPCAELCGDETFARTASRLAEMQGERYLAQPHRI